MEAKHSAAPATDVDDPAAAPETCLLDLPHHILMQILQQLDLVSLCAAARSSPILQQIAAHPSLWPTAQARHNWALGGIRACLADILRLPPLVFNAHLDARRSPRFPACVFMHNLRSILGTSDAAGLAETTSSVQQDRLALVKQNLWRYECWQDVPPEASMRVCRADGFIIRAALQPRVVVPRLLRQLQQAGWPPPPGDTTGTAAAASACSSADSMEQSLPPGVLEVLELCQHRMRQSIQLSQLQQLRGRFEPAQQAADSQQVSWQGSTWRLNRPALRAAVPYIPDETTARDFFSQTLPGSEGVDTAVQLLWANIIAYPGLLANDHSAQLQLAKAARLVVTLQRLQQSCGDESAVCDGGGSVLDAAWQQAGEAELQLCQSGLARFLDAVSLEHNPASEPAPLLDCLDALVTAAGEHSAACSAVDLQPVMDTEVLRAMTWCLWLLGVVL